MTAPAILGPTSVGKSRLGLYLARRLNGEILSIDSRQAYRRLDIGTAKPTPEERKEVSHHLLDVLDLEEKNNAEHFASLARGALIEVGSRGALPIMVGGSGLYFRAIFSGFFQIDMATVDRENFSDSVGGIPTEELYARLMSVDPESARRIHGNDRYRIVRALEVFELSGLSLSEHFRRQRKNKDVRETKYLKIGLQLPRGELHRRINERTRKMVEGGWIEEVERLLDEGAKTDWPGMKTLGYPEVISFLHGKIGMEEMIDRISALTRQYAKRQMTWFRKEKGVKWFRADDDAASGEALKAVEEAVRT